MPKPSTILEDEALPSSPPPLPHALSPIHNFTPKTISSLKTSPTVRVGDILHWAHQVIFSNLPAISSEQDTPTVPSSGTQPQNFTRRKFVSPDLHLTQEILDATITVTASSSLSDCLGALRRSQATSYNEDRVTVKVVAPLVSVLLAIFMALVDEDKYDWVADATHKCTSLEPQVEFDVVFTRLGFSLMPGLSSQLKNMVTAVEMKTPRSCNDPNNKSVADNGPLTDKKAQEIRDQLGKQGKLLKSLHPDKSFIIHGFSVAPAHLVPLASNGTQYLAIGSDVMNITDHFPVAVEKEMNWLDYIDKLAAFTLAIVHRHDEDIAGVVNSRFPDQKRQIDALYEVAGEALELTPLEILLNLLSTGLYWLQVMLSLPLLLLAQRLRLFRPIRSLEQKDCTPVSLDTSWLSFGLKLPPALSVHESNENMVYVYSRWGIGLVIKIFGNPTTYANELLCYQRLEKLQGAGIPVLYATGSVGTRPCLVLSYEGQRLRQDPTEEDRATLEPVIYYMHQLKIHHHDLHPRNVVRNGDGKLTLIDFGFSGPCTRGDCHDEWRLNDWY
ncbi:protein kinase subdomain-containing protein PKL/ccin4 [Coprinopsis cinerea okayama7|uniref:Protein kinase subdomain-containing protein PKL/ccin4 n=1 Tax=Coprinopsis cinerea (strain Okayama-7 / 130 / ATCC MYA-4618 / FGSC 9003) TaxID=240176 RepID=A8ND40_COPC7|nr:protein kinase subdomain-containing protein PKL/ccin4 [Coprinopsis cinerea okayama7\|eukprot:XP_001832692.2 protein kinase subdomain-containing protein PKL/ccin4 [Coprinopsis cinerea okayama7\